MSQQELMEVTPTFERGNTERPLLYLIEMRKRKTLLIPEFQRGSVWDVPRKRQWIETIINHQAIGVIVTYQIKGYGPIFLADGMQRLTAAKEFLEFPSNYGFDFGVKQAEAFCWAFSIPVQHRHYENHNVAMLAFQNLNKGTALTPAEFHKGELVLGSDVGRFLHEEVPQAINSIITSHLAGRSHSRNTASRYMRDSLGMFYQYIAKSKATDFWSVGLKQGTKQSVESRLREHIDDKKVSMDDASSRLRNFKAFIASEMAFILDAAQKAGHEKGKPFSQAALRNLLHAAIWRRNAERPRNLYEKLIHSLMGIWRGYTSFTSKIIIPNTEPIQAITLQTDSISHTKILCRKLGIELFEPSKGHSGEAAIGYDVSHVKPVSIFGEGETILEPSGVNRARGAKEIVMATQG